jgi:hypothetical protein
MSQRTRWIVSVSLVLVGLVVGVGMLAVAQLTDVPARPWAYVGLAVALIGAVSALLLAVIRAKDVSS